MHFGALCVLETERFMQKNGYRNRSESMSDGFFHCVSIVLGTVKTEEGEIEREREWWCKRKIKANYSAWQKGLHLSSLFNALQVLLFFFPSLNFF
jgi:hypothetical protein